MDFLKGIRSSTDNDISKFFSAFKIRFLSVYDLNIILNVKINIIILLSYV